MSLTYKHAPSICFDGVSEISGSCKCTFNLGHDSSSKFMFWEASNRPRFPNQTLHRFHLYMDKASAPVALCLMLCQAVPKTDRKNVERRRPFDVLCVFFFFFSVGCVGSLQFQQLAFSRYSLKRGYNMLDPKNGMPLNLWQGSRKHRGKGNCYTWSHLHFSKEDCDSVAKLLYKLTVTVARSTTNQSCWSYVHQLCHPLGARLLFI